MFVGGIIFFGISSCGADGKKADRGSKDSTLRALPASKDTIATHLFPPLQLDYAQTKVLKTLYVIDRDGVELLQGADANAPVLGKYPYGTKLDVIGEEGEWIAVMDRIQRNYKSANGEDNDVTQWEKVYVTKSKLGKQDRVALSPKDLNIIVAQKVNGKESYDENGLPLTDYLHLELIDEQTFLDAKRTAKDDLIKDTLSYTKAGRTLELPLANGKKLTFSDNDIDNESYAKYSYMGYFGFLNAFAVEGGYWESGDVRLFDRQDGHLIVECGDYPHFSADKNYLLTLHADPYESTGELQLFHVKQGRVSPMIYLSFKRWMPAGEGNLTFWGKDGNIYAAVNHVNAYWTDKGHLNERFQFIKIKVLKP